jgi:hypothetical protein
MMQGNVAEKAERFLVPSRDMGFLDPVGFRLTAPGMTE